jgi:endonuclease/exonuclease/phosphatase family metal-dependent hydrolase
MNIYKLIRAFAGFVFLFIIAIVSFYLWSSSSNLNEDSYSQLNQNNYAQNIENDSVYSIATYNIGYLSGMTNNRPIDRNKQMFTNNLKTVKKAFAALNPDIICFQEIDYNSNRSFFINQQNELAALGYNYVFQAINWDKKYVPFPYFPPSTHFGQVLSGQSILSKYPIYDTERIALERVKNGPFYEDAYYLDRLAQVTKVNIDSHVVILINVHLESFDFDTRRLQTEYIADLYKKYYKNFPTLLVGDFNSDLKYKNAAINLILEIPGIGSAKFDSENSLKTFPSNNPNERLDYIFYNTPFIELVNSEITTIVEDASDHLPVMMNFRFKKSE